MARTAEGYKLKRDPRTGIFIVRFTANGRPFKRSTGERDPRRAELAAARIYAEALSGRIGAKAPRFARGTAKTFNQVAAEWLAQVEPTVDALTFKLYQDVYVGTHFGPFFESIDRLTTVGV